MTMPRFAEGKKPSHPHGMTVPRPSTTPCTPLEGLYLTQSVPEHLTFSAQPTRILCADVLCAQGNVPLTELKSHLCPSTVLASSPHYTQALRTQQAVIECSPCSAFRSTSRGNAAGIAATQQAAAFGPAPRLPRESQGEGTSPGHTGQHPGPVFNIIPATHSRPACQPTAALQEAGQPGHSVCLSSAFPRRCTERRQTKGGCFPGRLDTHSPPSLDRPVHHPCTWLSLHCTARAASALHRLPSKALPTQLHGLHPALRYRSPLGGRGRSTACALR